MTAVAPLGDDSKNDKVVDRVADKVAASEAYKGNYLGKILFSGHSWTVPRISVPSALGKTYFGPNKKDQGVEWWFYVGNITDTDGVDYTIQSTLIRNCCEDLFINALTIGNVKTKEYLLCGGFYAPSLMKDSKFECLEPKDDQYHLSLDTVGFAGFAGFGADFKPDPDADTTQLNAALVTKHSCCYDLVKDSGNVGMVGAKYKLSDKAEFFEFNLKTSRMESVNVRVELFVEDKYGTVLEFVNGVSTGFTESDACTYEFAQPRLAVFSDKSSKSSITWNGVEKEIKSGNIWLDRQICNNAATPKGKKSLYVGTWITLCLFDDFNFEDESKSSSNEIPNTIVLANIWSKTKVTDYMVWQSGKELGRPPLLGEGNVYYRLPQSQEKYFRMNQGGKFLTDDDFSINILDTKNPNQSPHVQLDKDTAFGTAWKIDFENVWSVARTLYLFAFVDNTICGTDAWEGAVYIYTDKDKTTLCGTGWVEQMGYSKK